MATVSQLITRAGQALGYLGRNETLSAADANDGMSALNSMLDSWAGENLASYANQEVSFSFIANQQSYTIGSGGYINTTRPDNILQAYITDTNNINYPMSILPQDRWNNIGNKQITSQIPTTIFYDSQYPLGTIYVFPIPLLTYTCTLNAMLQQSTFTSLPQSMIQPPGYERAYILNLAIEMMSAGFPCMLDEKGLATLYDNAASAKANIKRKNQKEVLAEYDPSIVSRGYASYNIYSDSNPRGS